MRALAVMLGSLGSLGGAGCFPDSSWECDQDVSCSGGEVCARTHECLPASDVRGVRVRWTIEGQADTATACTASGIDHMAIAFSASETDQLAFAPVPCAGGLFFIDKLPLRMSEVDVRGQAADNRALFIGRAAIGPDLELVLDLLPAY